MLSVTLEFENGKTITIYAMPEDLQVFIETLRKAEPLKEVYIN